MMQRALGHSDTRTDRVPEQQQIDINISTQVSGTKLGCAFRIGKLLQITISFLAKRQRLSKRLLCD